MDLINLIIDSAIRGTLLGVTLVIWGFAIARIFLFLRNATKKVFNRLSSAADRKQRWQAVALFHRFLF